jgi:hypothetical protein
MFVLLFEATIWPEVIACVGSLLSAAAGAGRPRPNTKKHHYPLKMIWLIVSLVNSDPPSVSSFP